MATRRRNRFIYAQTAWMLGTVLALALLGSLTYELFFVVSLIGFLVVVELTAPFNVTPRWRARLKWLIVLGLVVFGYIVVRRILAILPPGVVEQMPGLSVALAGGWTGVRVGGRTDARADGWAGGKEGA